MFVGRSRDLDRLTAHLDRVRRSGEGVLLSLRGRRQVGKSRLLQEFLDRTRVPAAFFTAAAGATSEQERSRLLDAVAGSGLETATRAEQVQTSSWEAALALVGEVTRPSVLVLDEMPYLLAGDPGLEGVLQAVWDRRLARRPLLLVLVGSSVSTMAALADHDRPLFGRVREQVLEPLTPGEAREVVDLPAADVLDAHLVHGGLPRLLAEWEPGESPLAHVARQLEDSTCPLVVVGERVMAAEFPGELQAARVLRAVGSGARTFDVLGREAGVASGPLTRSLRSLVSDSRVVSLRRPLSARPSRLSRYEVADPYLRLWLRFLEPGRDLLLRGRGRALAAAVADAWPSYRGRAVEPLVRDAVENVLPHGGLPGAMHVGSWWTRDGSVEVDLVGATSAAAPTTVSFVGEVKWRERSPFDPGDARRLAARASRVPGAEDVPLVAVSRAGTTAAIDLALDPEDLLGRT